MTFEEMTEPAAPNTTIEPSVASVMVFLDTLDRQLRPLRYQDAQRVAACERNAVSPETAGHDSGLGRFGRATAEEVERRRLDEELSGRCRTLTARSDVVVGDRRVAAAVLIAFDDVLDGQQGARGGDAPGRTSRAG